MFLVYAPILAVGIYYFGTKCLPSPVRNVLSRVVSDAIVITAFALARATRYAAALRSAYVWEKRARVPTPLVKVLDALLRVDAERAHQDTSAGHASIQILQAVSTVIGGDNVTDHDITAILSEIWAFGDGVRIETPINLLLELLRLKDQDHEATVVTRIRYRGHSNVIKRYPSEVFTARYKCKLSQAFRFPPYASTTAVRRGLSVPRIIRANFVEDNGRMLYGPEAKESAGLRRDFYASVEDDPCLEKNVLTFLDPLGRYQEKMPIVVTTSKSNTKIFCNGDTTS